jgi:hypothetical protein
MPSFFRRVLDSVWQKGPIHKPKPASATDPLIGGYSRLRDAIAGVFEYLRTDILTLSYMRDPARTPRFDDLERDYGIKKDPNLSLQTRIDNLKVARYTKRTTAQIDELQRRIRAAGFDLYCYNNSPNGPPIDPATVLDNVFIMQAKYSTNYYAGNANAYAGKAGGYLLVNGPIFYQQAGISGAGNMWANGSNAYAGYFTGLVKIPVTYPTPTDPDDWPFVIFIGGVATYNPDGSIATIAQGLVPSAQIKQLEEIILKFKGAYAWAGMIITEI